MLCQVKSGQFRLCEVRSGWFMIVQFRSIILGYERLGLVVSG
jgi:hypothetical protein